MAPCRFFIFGARPTSVTPRHDDVRVGANALLLAGTVLEQGCIVAAGAVVGVHVLATYLALGNPAHVMPSSP